MLVFIDGENFRQVLNTILVNTGVINERENFKYDLVGLLNDILGTDDLQIKYYSSRVKPPRGHDLDEHTQYSLNKIKEASRKWTSHLMGQGVECIKAGSLKIKEESPCSNCQYKQVRFQEKGVDVRLALDMFEASLDDKTSAITVVSSDTDLCPTYHKIMDRGVNIQYVCFAAFVNRAVSAATNETVTITTEKAVKFIEKSR